MKSRSKSQKVVKQTLTPRQRLSANDIQELKQTFDLFDQDQGGTIDPSEIQKILQELGLDRRNTIVYNMIKDLQQKNKGVNFQEFLQIICNRLGDTKSRDGMQKLFDLYDVDNTGYIDFQNLKNVAKQLGQTMNDEQIVEMMHNTHILNKTESNEFFTFEEFYTIVTKKKY